MKFVLFTSPTVLGLALPFAGAFASTLTFLRLSNDNEIIACSASGISYRRLLAPVFGLGLVLTVCLLLLANQVVPHFFRLAAQAATRDAVGLMAGQLANHEPFLAKGIDPQGSQSFVIYADETVQHEPPTGLDTATADDPAGRAAWGGGGRGERGEPHRKRHHRRAGPADGV